jgi:copper(I)-binding protein
LSSQRKHARSQILLWLAVAILIDPAQLSAEPRSESTPSLKLVSAVSHPSAGAAVGVIYLHILNPTERDDRLVAVVTAAAARAEFHETVVEGDFVRMIPKPEGFEIARAAELVLESGGKHIMLLGLTEPLESGGTIELELVFEHGGRLEIRVPIRPRSF